MTSAWDTAATLPVRPPDSDLNGSDVVVTDQGTYWECGLTDWHLMLGWFAGPETLARYPDNREQWWDVIVEVGGDREISRRRVSDEDRREADEDINQGLRERGLPERPGGFRWFQLVPPGGTGRDVVAAYIGVQRDMPRGHDMVRQAAYARAAVEQLYGLPVTPPPPIPPEAWEPQLEDPEFIAERRAERERFAEAITGPPGAVPVLTCRSFTRSLPFYAGLGFQSQNLDGYAVLRNGATELHLSQTSTTSTGGCLIRVPDAAALWQQLHGQATIGPLEEDDPGMLWFLLLDPDNNQLRYVSER